MRPSRPSISRLTVNGLHGATTTQMRSPSWYWAMTRLGRREDRIVVFDHVVGRQPSTRFTDIHRTV